MKKPRTKRTSIPRPHRTTTTSKNSENSDDSDVNDEFSSVASSSSTTSSSTSKSSSSSSEIKHFDKIEDFQQECYTTSSSSCMESLMIGFENKIKLEECVRYGKYSPLEAYSIDMHLKYLNIYANIQGSTIYIWKFEEKSKIIHIIENEQKQVEYYCIKWGEWKDRTILAVCGSCQFVTIYDIEILKENVKTKMIGNLNGHGNSVNCICFHPSMNGLVLTGSNDHSIRLWNLNLNFQTVAIFQSHLAGVISLSFHQSGKYFVSGAMDNTCRIFEINDQVMNFINFKNRYHYLESIQHNNLKNTNMESNLMNENEIHTNFDDKYSNHCTCNIDSINVIKLPIIKSSSVYLYHRGYVDSCLFMGDLIFSKTNSSESSTNDPGDSVIVWKPDSVTEHCSEFTVKGEEDEISIVHRFKGSQSYFWWLKMAISDKYLARPLHDGRVEIFSFEHVGLSFYSRPAMVLNHSSELIREVTFTRDSKYLLVLQSNGKITRWKILD